MNGQVNPPPLVTFPFYQKVPVGTAPGEPPGDPNREHILVVEDFMPSWGRLKSFELTILRDGRPALDMLTYSFGVEPESDKWNVKFQIWDACVDSILNHEYEVTAKINYYPE